MYFQHFGDRLWDVSLLSFLCWRHWNKSFSCFTTTVSLPLDTVSCEEPNLICLRPSEPGALAPVTSLLQVNTQSKWSNHDCGYLSFKISLATDVSVWQTAAQSTLLHRNCHERVLNHKWLKYLLSARLYNKPLTVVTRLGKLALL